MYVIIRTIKAQKGLEEQLMSWLTKPSVVSKFDGFVKKDVLFSKSHRDYDVYSVQIYWTDKEAFYRFEGSPEHIAMHKNKQERPLGIIEVTHQGYSLVASIIHD